MLKVSFLCAEGRFLLCLGFLFVCLGFFALDVFRDLEGFCFLS